jgi:glucose-1-phosphate thymidylyltransferase
VSGEQAEVASTGVKALIPIGRPFLDYVLDAAAEAGLSQIGLVIGPEHDAIREYYRSLAPTRLQIDFIVQHEPRGTADAVLAAEAWTAGEPFFVLNSDNYYPVSALAALAALDEPALVAFSRKGCWRKGRSIRRASPASRCSICTATTSRESSKSRIRPRSPRSAPTST